MIKENLHKSYAISFETAEMAPNLEHKHSFFELVYIRSGTGAHHLNNHVCSYKAGKFFMLTPEDSHFFEIETTTAFFFLRFNNIYLKKIISEVMISAGLNIFYKMPIIIRSVSLKNIADRSLVAPIIESIFREHTVKDVYNEEMTHQLVNTLIVIVARNIAKFLPEYISDTPDGKALDILQYIQQNIYEPEKLEAAHISNVFAISDAYLGKYFKKHTNETLQGYITKYKTNLIEHRLKLSDKRMNEIADEFGFTDVSHLNKFFKKQKGNNLSTYREGVRV